MGVKEFLKKKTASNNDIDSIIAGTYKKEGKDGLLAASDRDIDNIIAGMFKKRGRGWWG